MSTKDFELIYDTYYEKVLGFVKKRVTNQEVAEDLTGDIFEKILKYMEDFKWQGITVSAWIFRIARNHIIDYYRKNSKRKKDKSLEDVVNFVESSAPNVEVEIEADEEEQALYKAIQELAASEQYLVYYKFFEGMANKEIADLTGMTETNVGTKLHRIRKKIEEIIKETHS